MKKLFFALTLFTLTIISTLCAHAGSWQKDHVGWWYRFDNGSYLNNTWFQDGGLWYYFNDHGYMVTNCWIDNYYLGESGYMLTGTITPDGYRVGTDGAWIPSAGRIVNIDYGYYYVDTDQLELFSIQDNNMNVNGTFHTYDYESHIIGDYLGFNVAEYSVNNSTRYFEKETFHTAGYTTLSDLMLKYNSGLVNYIAFHVEDGIVKELLIQTKKH